jgi:hypothetical protein
MVLQLHQTKSHADLHLASYFTHSAPMGVVLVDSFLCDRPLSLRNAFSSVGSITLASEVNSRRQRHILNYLFCLGSIINLTSMVPPLTFELTPPLSVAFALVSAFSCTVSFAFRRGVSDFRPPTTFQLVSLSARFLSLSLDVLFLLAVTRKGGTFGIFTIFTRRYVFEFCKH